MDTASSDNQLVFTQGRDAIDVHLHGQTLWLTQLQMATLFGTTPENVLMHLKNVFADGELDAAATAKDFLAVRQEGHRQVKRRLKHYNLDAIISVGYRVSSVRATQFRIWATGVLRTIRDCARTWHLLRRFIVCLSFILATLAGFALPAHAQKIVRIEPAITPDGRLEIAADVDLTLNSALSESAARGVALYFTAELDILAPRWWWFDRTVATRTRTWRIAYNALTRQWLTRIDGVAWPVASLDEAMRLVTHIRGWSVADAKLFDAGQHYRGRLRLRLDTSQLARPFQVHAINSSAWSIETPWTPFSFTLADVAQAKTAPGRTAP